jgi:hypothetical protein
MRTLRKHAPLAHPLPLPGQPACLPASQPASQPAAFSEQPSFYDAVPNPFFRSPFAGANERARECICVHDRTVQKNNKDTRHNEELRAPRLGDNYREPTLQPSKGLNVKCYTSRHHHGSFYRNVRARARAAFAPSSCPPPPPPAQVLSSVPRMIPEHRDKQRAPRRS